MSVTVKHITLWRAEVDNKPGVLARTLESLAAAGADLHVVMGYRYPGGGEKAAIEVYPVTAKKSVAAAQAAGLGASAIPTLLVEGDDKPGLAHAVCQDPWGHGNQLEFCYRAGDRSALCRCRWL